MGLAASGARGALSLGKGRRDHAERFGILPSGVEQRIAGRAVVWLHAASVGEVLALGELLRLLRQRLPGAALVVSTTSRAGRELAGRMAEGDLALILPFDAPAVVARVLDRIRPSLLVITETELWPTLLGALAERHVPVVLLSARVSERAFGRYRRVRAALAPVLPAIRFFGAQSEIDAERFRALGADPARIAVTGSLKEDRAAAEASVRLTGSGPVWVAGSTHRGEEAACIAVFRRLRERRPDLRLVLAPRHLERLPEVERLLGDDFVRRSSLGEEWSGSPGILLVNTLGELAGLYGLGAVAFVGGTLEPIGGHNLREPARAGVPVLFGPHVDSVRAEARALEASQGGLRVADADELESALAALLADEVRRAAMAAAARTTFPFGEVARRSIEAIEPWLPEMST